MHEHGESIEPKLPQTVSSVLLDDQESLGIATLIVLASAVPTVERRIDARAGIFVISAVLIQAVDRQMTNWRHTLKSIDETRVDEVASLMSALTRLNITLLLLQVLPVFGRHGKDVPERNSAEIRALCIPLVQLHGSRADVGSAGDGYGQIMGEAINRALRQALGLIRDDAVVELGAVILALALVALDADE